MFLCWASVNNCRTVATKAEGYLNDLADLLPLGKSFSTVLFIKERAGKVIRVWLTVRLEGWAPKLQTVYGTKDMDLSGVVDINGADKTIPYYDGGVFGVDTDLENAITLHPSGCCC